MWMADLSRLKPPLFCVDILETGPSLMLIRDVDGTLA